MVRKRNESDINLTYPPFKIHRLRTTGHCTLSIMRHIYAKNIVIKKIEKVLPNSLLSIKNVQTQGISSFLGLTALRKNIPRFPVSERNRTFLFPTDLNYEHRDRDILKDQARTMYLLVVKLAMAACHAYTTKTSYYYNLTKAFLKLIVMI